MTQPHPSTKTPRQTKAKTKTKKLTRRDILSAIFLVAWTIISMIAAQLIIGLPLSWILGAKLNLPFWMGIYYITTYALSVSLVIFFPPLLWKVIQKNHSKTHANANTKTTADHSDLFTTTPDELGIDQLPTLVDLGLAPIGYIVYAILANILLNIMQIFPWFDANQPQDVGFTAGYLSGSGKIIAIICLVIIAPLAEEIIMRGWLYGKLRARTNLWLAILLTSFTFALLHGQWNVSAGIFMLSIVLCSLREITGTIWSGVLLHMLTNGIAFYILYIASPFAIFV